MSIHDGMHRVESAVSATASGNLTYGQWPYDVSTALGFSGQRNPLGFAVVRYLSSDPSAALSWDIVLHLATAIARLGHPPREANDAAWTALNAWNSIKCPHCSGRGVTNQRQAVCPDCCGSGERNYSSLAPIIRDGLSCLMEAERWMEGQLAAKMKRES